VAYDEQLAARIRRAVEDRPDVSERKMFGGIAFMCSGKMFAGVMGNDLLARVAPGAYDEALSRPGAGVMDFTGRPMAGFIVVDGGVVADNTVLNTWLDEGLAYAASLPAGTPGRRRTRRH